MIAIVNCLAAGFSELVRREVGRERIDAWLQAGRGTATDAGADAAAGVAPADAVPADAAAGALQCDGDALMDTAFLSLMRRRPFPRSEVDVEMMRKARAVARQFDFDADRIRGDIHATHPCAAATPATRPWQSAA